MLMLARDLQYLAFPEYADLDKQRDKAGKVLWALYRSVRASIGG
jgi:hypothetical protein